jgi:hypothetical protein
VSDLAGFRWLSDILSGGIPPMNWLVEDVLPAQSLAVIAGPPKTFKSFVALDLSLGVATGARFLGTFAVPDPGPVVLCVSEGGLVSLTRRAATMLESLGGSPEDVSSVPVTTRAIDLTDRRAIRDLRDVILKVHPRLVVLDPLYTGLASVDTSQLPAVGAALRNPAEAAAEVGATVVLVHHTVKGADRSGLARVWGAGVAEWASIILLGTPLKAAGPGPRRAVRWELIGRDIPGFEFETIFELGTPETPSYHVEVTIEPGEEQSDLGLSWPEQRVLSALKMLGPSGGDLHRIDDVLALDGLPFTHVKLREVLNELVDRGLADGAVGIWWAAEARSGVEA